MITCRGMRPPFLPFPDALPPADARPGRRTFRARTDRRAAYQQGLPLGLVAALLPLALLSPVPAGLLTTLPLLAGLLGLVLALSLLERCPLWVLDLLLLAGGWLLLLSQLALPLFGPGAAGDAARLGSAAPWLPVLLLISGWLLGERRGRELGGAALGLTLALTLAFAAGPMRGRGAEGPALLQALVQLLLAGGITLLGQAVTTRRTRAAARQGLWAELPDHERDALTGLPGPRTLKRVLTGHLRHHPAGLTVALLSVDHLEAVGVREGVAFAEALRAHVARTLSAAIRDEDVIGCLGGPTFAVLMRMPSAHAARGACERLRLRVASRPLGGVLPTVSVGVAVWAGHPDGTDLLASAQQALALAQGEGGNRVQRADDRVEVPAA